tara:strand:+ start:961 stop:1242 length:282 start_codon:yes stop_codon:yes gene_type:complete
MKITKSRLVEIIKEELEEACMAKPISKPNGEGKMAKSQLLRSLEYSQKLMEMLEDDEHLESWVQAKITLASDYLGKVYHYLHGEEVMHGDMEE